MLSEGNSYPETGHLNRKKSPKQEFLADGRRDVYELVMMTDRLTVKVSRSAKTRTNAVR